MVVAACATERDSQERGRGRAQHVVELIVAVDHRLGRLIVPGSQPQKCGGDLGGSVGALDLIARQLLDQKPVVRLVLVEGVDHVVAVSPGVRLVAVALVAVGFGVTDDIQPMPRPALSILRAGQQVINHLGDRIGRLVIEERPDFVRGRRQADQVEIKPADQGPSIGRSDRLDPLRLHLGQDEAIDGIARPGRVGHSRYIGPPDRLEGPMLFLFVSLGRPGDRLRNDRQEPSRMRSIQQWGRSVSWAIDPAGP